jgi:DNA-binding NtrC family response regulator
MPTFADTADRFGGMSVLVVEQDATVRAACCEIATRLGFLSYCASKPQEAEGALRNLRIDVLLLDLTEEATDSLKLLGDVKTLYEDTVVVVMSAFATVPAVVEAMRTGASDLLTKPFASEKLGTVLERACERRTGNLASHRLRERLRTQRGVGRLIGGSTEMEKVYRILSKVAQSRHPVLILGESGTGKELVARSIHSNGPNPMKPFLVVDCGSLAPTLIESELFGHAKGAFTGANYVREGLLASAGSGTLFLDEIGELPLDLQARLLRVLQEKEVRPVGAIHRVPIHARILAATNRDLHAMVGQGLFREDLFYRLSVVNIHIPPLRDRRDDIPLLIAHFLDRLGRERTVDYSMTDEALRLMVEYPWPGNIRELEHTLQRATTVSSSRLLQRDDLSSQILDFALQLRGNVYPATDEAFRSGANGHIVPLAEMEKQAIFKALNSLQGDKLKAAKVLGIGKTTLYRKLKEYGVFARPWVPLE